jgi:hypothetical protein
MIVNRLTGHAYWALPSHKINNPCLLLLLCQGMDADGPLIASRGL